MCDMCQWVICVAITTTEASNLAQMFMEHVLLKFGICVMVVCNDGNEFRGTFEKMCNKLNIKYHIVAKRDHKTVGVERFHRVLNKAEENLHGRERYIRTLCGNRNGYRICMERKSH